MSLSVVRLIRNQMFQRLTSKTQMLLTHSSRNEVAGLGLVQRKSRPGEEEREMAASAFSTAITSQLPLME